MILAARLREDLGLPGLTVDQTGPFRDKERMVRHPDLAATLEMADRFAAELTLQAG